MTFMPGLDIDKGSLLQVNTPDTSPAESLSDLAPVSVAALENIIGSILPGQRTSVDSPLDQLRNDAMQTLGQIHTDATSVLSEIVTPFNPNAGTSPFGSFLGNDQSQQNDLDTSTQQGLDKERNERLMLDLMEQSAVLNNNQLTSKLINSLATSFLAGTEAAKDKDARFLSIGAAMITSAFESAAREIQKGQEERKDIQETVANYAASVADDPAAIGQIAALVPRDASAAEIRGIVEAYLAAQRAQERTQENVA